MAFDSSADLLFRIIGDSSPAKSEMDGFRAAMRSGFGDAAAASKAASTSILYDWAGSPIKTIAKDFAVMGEGAALAARRTTGEMTAARMAVRGLSQEIGVGMPRYLTSWLTSLGPVAGIMSAAFAPIAVIGLIQVLASVPGHIQKIVDRLHGWTDEVKKAFEDQTQSVMRAELALIEYNERLRAIGLIGLEGIGRLTAENRLNSQSIDEVLAKLIQYKDRINDLQRITEAKAPAPKVGKIATAQLGNAESGPKLPTHAEVEKAKSEIDILNKGVEELQGKLQELDLERQRIAAEVKAETAKDAAQEEEAAARFTEGLQRRLLTQAEQTLAVKHQEADAELDELREEYAKKAEVTGQQEKLLADLRKATHDRIDREDAEARDKAKQQHDKWLLDETAELQHRIDAQSATTRAGREREFNEEMNDLMQKARIEKGVTTGELEGLNLLVEEARAAGLAKMRAQWAEEDRLTDDRLKKELAGEATSLQAKHDAEDAKVDMEIDALKREGQLTEQRKGVLEAARRAGHAKIDADARVAGDTEIARLLEERQRIEGVYAASEDKIAAQYQADLAKFSAAEERKSLVLATSDAQRAQISAQFAALRQALYTREQGQLQMLSDSTGWQGVFGSKFQEMIRSNTTLMSQWASGVSQGALLVKASLAGLEEQGGQAFKQLAQGMGAGIAHAIVYGGSVSKAMREALAATLESISAQSMVQAIYALALGFLDLAEGDPEAAGNAFAAAAIFGSVGTAAAVAGRGVAGPQGAGAAAGGGAGGSYRSGPGVGQFGSDMAARQANEAAGFQDGGNAGSGRGTHVTVNVYGHVYGTSGVQELMNQMNDAVLNQGASLTATNTKTGVQVTR